jgi:hypothetical protein
VRHSFGRGGLWRPALVAAAAGLLQLVSTAPAGAGRIGPLVQVSSDPFVTRGFEHRTEVEPDILAVGHSVVAAFQVGRASEGGAEAIGVATSTDEGRTWSSETLAGATVATGGSFGRASDPSVTFDARTGSWLIGYLAVTVTAKFEVPTRSAIEVARSTAGTISFGEPIDVARRRGPLEPAGADGRPSAWLRRDPRHEAGRLRDRRVPRLCARDPSSDRCLCFR